MRLSSSRPSTVISVLAVTALLAVAACGGEAKPGSESALPPASEDSRAPDVFRVHFETSKGSFVLQAHRRWAPRGVDRLHQLVTSGFFDNTRFFRAVSGFMVQFGVHGDPAVNSAWEKLNIRDDSVTQSNQRGTMSFAMGGPDTRTTQVFINLVDNTPLNGMGFAPVGVVVEGMDVVDSLYTGYGDGPPAGFGPDQMRIMSEGNAYLEREYPRLDFIRSARIVPAAPAAGAGDSAR
ncbi:MAG: peptidylprolyl isomerase [Gemmatimonadaceae bacterium]